MEGGRGGNEPAWISTWEGKSVAGQGTEASFLVVVVGPYLQLPLARLAIGQPEEGKKLDSQRSVHADPVLYPLQ